MDAPTDEAEAMQIKIRDGEEDNFPENDDEIEVDPQHDPYPGMLKTSFLFMAEAFQQIGNMRLVRFILRRNSFFFQRASKSIMEEKPFYVGVRIYIRNQKPFYIQKRSSVAIFTEQGYYPADDEYYEKILRKYEFVSEYL